MSQPVDMPSPAGKGEGDKSPTTPTTPTPISPRHLIPSPIITRRTRTYSASERALREPEMKGTVKSFCRERGHGFIVPAKGGEPLFVHISDIEGEYVPKPGDEISFRKTLAPPKMEKYQAVHVRIIHLVPGTVHERWDAPYHPTESHH